MDTTTNTQPNNQPNNQLPVDPTMNQAKPSDLAVTKEAPKVEGKTAECEMMNADVKVLSGEALTVQPSGNNGNGNGHGQRDQLYRRVMARVGELEKALAGLEGTNHNTEHASALRVELDIAKDAMSGGWDHVGEIEAARLSKWLETSQTLVGSGRTDPASAGQNLDPASGEPRNTKLPADGAVAVDGSDQSVKATQTP